MIKRRNQNPNSMTQVYFCRDTLVGYFWLYPSLKLIMPLVKIFAKLSMTKPIPLASLQSKLCKIWGTEPNTTKLMLSRVQDWTDESYQEDCYVDIRAYGKQGT
jgi:hypothetical protein